MRSDWWDGHAPPPHVPCLVENSGSLIHVSPKLPHLPFLRCCISTNMTEESSALPSSLSILSDIGVVVCAEHGSSYVLSTLGQHLLDKHQVKLKTREDILTNAARDGVVAAHDGVSRPLDGSDPVPGLPIHDGFQCTVDHEQCRHLSISEAAMRRHCRTVHEMRSSTTGRPKTGSAGSTAQVSGYRSVRLQTLFKKKTDINYFTISPWTLEGADTDIAKVNVSSSLLVSNSDQVSPGAAEERLRQYEKVLRDLDDEQMKNVKTGEIQHVSELSAWLKQTGYHAYLDGLDDSEYAKAYGLPEEGKEPALAIICKSIERLFLKSSNILDFDTDQQRMLSNLNARLLNTFQKSETSADPIKSLQNQKSKQNYIQTIQRLAGFFSRVKKKMYLTKKKMFTPTVAQIFKWEALESMAQEIVEGDKQEDARAAEDLEALDQHTLEFIMSLIAHRLPVSSFDSPIISFVAVMSWSPHRKTWIKMGNYTSLLARLTYCCQLFTLLHCMKLSGESETRYLSDCITEFRDQWLLNSTESPVGTMLSMRLLGQKIARMEVQQVTIRWPDEQTVSYGDVRITMGQIRKLLQHELDAAQAVFDRDLCFGLEGAPQYDLGDVIENWQADQPGASFLTNSQNTRLFDEGRAWLYNRINATPDVSEPVYSRGHDGTWRLKDDVVKMYEKAVQRFLEHMAIVLHIGSGQPARRPEFLGLRWRNRDKAVRNLYVEKGRMMFILSYHKMLHVHNASRFPVRVLLPEAAKLLTQYLTLIIPFRSWMLRTSRENQELSSYLFANSRGIWTTDRWTRLLSTKFEQVTGVRVTIQAWRQIAVAIAIKFFGGRGRVLETAMYEDDEDGGQRLDEEDGMMPVAFHWQASHTPRVGNRAYASRIDYQGGLTDQGVDEYIRISEMWQEFLLEGMQPLSATKHMRGMSSEGGVNLPLLKRIAVRDVTQRYRRQWSMDEAKAVLRDMYGPDAKYKSAWQEKAVQAVMSGLTPVIVVLGTGEGKSLLYMMQQRLPGAGTTVLVVPLVALKQDTAHKCKKLGIDCLVWDHAIGGRIGSELVLVSVERALSNEFQQELEALSSAGRLSSIVVDECHLVLTASSYRWKMMDVREFRKFGCQMVFLTATLPQYMMASFCDRLLLASPVVVRGPTMRRDIQYETMPCVHANLVKQTASLVRSLLKLDMYVDEGEARLVIYCRTRPEVDSLADELGCARYYSDSASNEEKEQAMASWMAGGEGRTIVATSAFGAGIDHASVRTIVLRDWSVEYEGHTERKICKCQGSDFGGFFEGLSRSLKFE